MLYDLNVAWSATQEPQELQRTISFLSELGYDTVALNHNVNVPLPAKIINPIPLEQPFPLPKKTTLLRRCTLHFADPSQNYRLPELARAYDILALRPTTEKAYLAACTALSENSIISLDLAQRFPFHFRPKQVMTAVNRGIFFELCYSPAAVGDSSSRRNVINNVLGLLRASCGRGLIVSSQAKNALGLRAPADVVNLLCVWGMGREKALESLDVNPRAVVVNEGIKRTGFRGVINVIDGGELPKNETKENEKGVIKGPQGGEKTDKTNKNKRKVEEKESNSDGTPTISKRKAKKMRLEALKANKTTVTTAQEPDSANSLPQSNTSGDTTPNTNG
ncbi:hypothetical protein BP6252_07163 [Coleophoma cylindrospora]|uniref:Uncharacterized protein n=1 Tax=Coleophoma cylindrospora TaxID=1849047 RepID=A0A3D8RH26_9HELO|nr:hypothetical protein BP6252_07163 [Coleophoma cylindrospora]